MTTVPLYSKLTENGVTRLRVTRTTEFARDKIVARWRGAPPDRRYDPYYGCWIDWYGNFGFRSEDQTRSAA